jgi:hypothetical protein
MAQKIQAGPKEPSIMSDVPNSRLPTATAMHDQKYRQGSHLLEAPRPQIRPPYAMTSATVPKTALGLKCNTSFL